MSDKTTTADTPKRKGKALIIGLAATLLIAGGGAGAWVMMKPPADAEALEHETSAKKKPTVFVPLEQFTVNLGDEGGDRMAQIALTLEVIDGETESAMKARMPAVRNSILLLLSASESAQVLTVAGKQQLAAQILDLTGRHLGWQPPAPTIDPSAVKPASSDAAALLVPQPAETRRHERPNPVIAVHFSHFIVQ